MRKVLLQWLQIVVGLAVAGLGVHLTIFADIGLAPWDCLSMGISYHTPMNYGVSMMVLSIGVLLVGLGKRLPKIPIGIVEVLLWGAVIAVGWLLGGPVGIGTLICTFGASLVMQAVYSVIHFEPRSIRHRDVVELEKELIGKKAEA